MRNDEQNSRGKAKDENQVEKKIKEKVEDKERGRGKKRYGNDKKRGWA